MIKKIEIKHFKDIKDLENLALAFNYKDFYLKASNGMGKSSLMDAIKISMGNTSCIPQDKKGRWDIVFNKNGEEINGRVSVSEGKSKIELHFENGDIITSKEKIKEVFGIMDFDISEFVRLSNSKAGRKEQLEYIVSMYSSEDKKEIDKYNETIKHYEEVRTEIGREKKKIEGYVHSHKMHGNDVKYEKIDLQELLDKKEKLDDFKNKIDIKEDKINSNLSELEKLHDRIKILNEETNILLDQVKVGKEVLKEKDYSSLTERIKSSEKDNENYRLMNDYEYHSSELKKKNNEYDGLTKQIESKRIERSNFIKSIVSPLEGVSFDEDQVTYNGIPITNQNMCDSDISVLGIEMAMASNNKCDIVFIESLNIVENEKRDKLFKKCKEKGMQIFAEIPILDKKEKLNILEINIE